MDLVRDVNTALSAYGYTERVKDESQVIFKRSVARMRGTGYRNHIYHIPSLGLQYTRKDWLWPNAKDGVFHGASIEKLEDVKNRNKTYAQLCGEAARKFKIPFEVALAIGPEKAEHLKVFKPISPDADQLWELKHCGINRRKSSIRELLGEELYNALEIEQMGQSNSARIASWLSSHADETAREELQEMINNL